MSTFQQTELTRVRRIAQRASYDVDTVHGILDAAWACTVAFVVDGQPHAIPTAHWRIEDTLYIHGSNGSRLLRALGEGAPASLAVTLVDGLVLARSAFHHSINYRSAMVYGAFRTVSDPEEKLASLKAFMDKVAEGRWQEVRQPDANEMAATTVLALKIEQAVAKQRNGGPKDDEADMSVPVWAGIIPLESRLGAPVQF